MAFKFSRGVWAKDIITGFVGCITARTDSLTGCNRYLLEPTVDENGKKGEGWWFDEHSLEIDTTKQQVKLHREPEQPPG